MKRNYQKVTKNLDSSVNLEFHEKHTKKRENKQINYAEMILENEKKLSTEDDSLEFYDTDSNLY